MTLGVAFAGGGLKGFAYIGVIKALEELNIKPDFLSGTSSGSIFATLYAIGFSSDEIKEIAIQNYNLMTKVNKRNILKAGISYFKNGITRTEGLISGENIENIIKTNSKNILNMNEIKIPYAIVSVDTITTKECVFLSKELDLEKEEDVDYIYNAPIAKATRASMSFPGIYTSCNYDRYNLIDGGTKNNLPTDILKKMGADKVLALSFKIDEYIPSNDIFAVLLRATDIFSLKNVRKAQKEANLSIEIDALGANLLKICDIEKIIKSGYDAIMINKEKIISMIGG